MTNKANNKRTDLKVWKTGKPTDAYNIDGIPYDNNGLDMRFPVNPEDHNAMNEDALRDDALSPEDFVWKRKAADMGYAGFTHEMVDELEALAKMHRNKVARQAKARDEAVKG